MELMIGLLEVMWVGVAATLGFWLARRRYLAALLAAYQKGYLAGSRE